MDNSAVENKCKNCGSTFKELYCNNCGQKLIQERNSVKQFVRIIIETFDIEKGLLYTLKMLFVNPGQLINEYLDGRTRDYYNPLKYLLLITGIYAILIISFGVFDKNIENTNELLGYSEEQLKLQNIINDYIRKFLNIMTIITLPFFSLVSKWVFKKRKQYFGEHLVINSFLFAQYTLIQTIIILFLIFFPSFISYFQVLGIFIFIIYYSYALKSIYGIKLFKSFLNATAIYSIGMLLFFTIIITLTLIVLTTLAISGVNIKDLIQ